MKSLLLLAGLCLLVQAEPEKLHLKLTRGLNQASKVDDATLAAGRTCPAWGARYAVTLIEIQRSLERGGGFETTWKGIAEWAAQGGPKGAPEHLKALAASFKKAVYCGECKEEKAACPQCKGQGKTDVPCKECKGSGRTVPPNAPTTSVKCRNCDGNKVFKNVGCPGCSKSGTVGCPACKGKPWREKLCTAPGCKDGRVPCKQCLGQKSLQVKCSDCDGKGRTAASGNVGGANFTVKCRGCDGNGTLTERVGCPSCKDSAMGMGYERCPACSAPGGAKLSIPLSSVYTTSPCAACGGRGWPAPAAACAKCAGLGVKVSPVSDPAKTIE